jgi:hypothetical protein
MSVKYALVFRRTEQADDALMSIGFCPAGCDPARPIIPYGKPPEGYPTTDKGIIIIGHLYEGGAVVFDANENVPELEPFRDKIRRQHERVITGAVSG